MRFVADLPSAQALLGEGQVEVGSMPVGLTQRGLGPMCPVQITRLVAARALLTLAESPLKLDLSSILSDAIKVG